MYITDQYHIFVNKNHFCIRILCATGLICLNKEKKGTVLQLKIMPSRKRPVKNSLAVNPDAARLLQNLITSCTTQPNDRASEWRNHLVYGKIFASIDTEKFRKHFRKLFAEKHTTSNNKKCTYILFGLVVTFLTFFSICTPRNTQNSNGNSNEKDTLTKKGSMDNEKGGLVFNSCEAPSVTAIDFLSHKPIFIMPNWRHPRTRDRCVALIVLLPTGILDSEDNISAPLENETTVSLSFSWTSILLNPLTLVSSILSICLEMDETQRTLLALDP